MEKLPIFDYLCLIETNSFIPWWMMVIVPRIAVPYLNTIPFIYGIGHEGNLRAELLLSPAVCAKNFAEHKADIALVPAAAVPSLADAEIVTEYCTAPPVP
ncbi:MAG: hypothetical protein ACLTSJ_09895 [Alistipes communis]